MTHMKVEKEVNDIEESVPGMYLGGVEHLAFLRSVMKILEKREKFARHGLSILCTVSFRVFAHF